MWGRQSRSGRALAWLLAATAAGAVGGAEPREIPPDRGRLFLRDAKEVRAQLERLSDAGAPLVERIDAINVLALTREKRATPLLIGIVRGRGPMPLRVAALLGLSEVGDPRGVVAFQYALRQLYVSAPPWSKAPPITFQSPEGPREIPVRQFCEQELGRLAGPVVGKLIDLLLEPLEQGYETSPNGPHRKEDEADGRRRAALISLAAVGDRDIRAVRALCRILTCNDGYYPWDFKIMAVQALAGLVERRRKHLAPLEAKDHMADSIANAFIEAATVTELPEVREIVGWTLRRMGWADRAAKTLVAVLETRNLPKTLHYRVIEALANMQSKASADELIFQLYDPDRNVRWRAAIALGTVGDRRAIPYLRKLSRDRDPFIRTKVVAALGHMEAAEALPDLAVATEDPDFHVRRQACLAIGRVGRPEGIPALVSALKDPRPTVRAYAVIGLGYIGRARGLKYVAPLVRDPEPGVRLVAVQVLARFLNPGATRALVAALGDEDERVRGIVLRGVNDRLARRPKDTIPALVDAIATGKGTARFAAIACIDADYRKPAENLRDPRKAIYLRLAASASSPLTAALVAALEDESPKCRAAAGRFLIHLAWHRRPRDRAILERVARLASDTDRRVSQVGRSAGMYLQNLP